MSLINRMLLELDARRGAPNNGDEVIISDLQPVPHHSAYYKRIKIYSLAVAGLALMTTGILYLPLFNPEQPEKTVISAPVHTKAESTHLTQGPNSVPGNPAVNSAVATTNTGAQASDTVPVIAALPAITPPPPTTSAKTVPMPATAPRPVTDKATARNNTAAEIKPEKIRPAMPLTTAAAPITKVQTKPADNERNAASDRQFATALRYYQQGHMAQSLQLLNKTLSQQPDHIKAREVLGSILMQQQRWQEAEQTLLAGIKLSPGNTTFRRLLARLKVEQGQEEMAIAILEKPLQHGYLDAESSALLALLYQRQGQHQTAALHYKYALRTQPTQGKWLLGLAISQEAQRQWINANRSYHLAATSNDLSPQLQEYARQRQLFISQQQTTAPIH